MAHSDLMAAQPRAVLGGEMHPMGNPRAWLKPMAVLQPVNRPIAEFLNAKILFVPGFAQVGMQAAVVALSHFGRSPHQFPGNRERRTWRQNNLRHGSRSGIMIALQHPFAIGKNSFAILHYSLGRDCAVPHRPFQRASRNNRANADGARLIHLYVSCVLNALEHQVVVIHRRRAARKQ